MSLRVRTKALASPKAQFHFEKEVTRRRALYVVNDVESTLGNKPKSMESLRDKNVLRYQCYRGISSCI